MYINYWKVFVFMTIEYSISHVLSFCTISDGQSGTKRCNHLSASCSLPLFRLNSLIKDAPTFVWVAHSWGLPRSTQDVSTLATSLWHFQGPLPYLRDLGIILPFYLLVTLTYVFVKHEHYKHLSLCEHGLSSAARSDYMSI